MQRSENLSDDSEDRSAPSEICDECGAMVAGGRQGCTKLFDQVLAREFSDFRYARFHRLTVDTYSLQHPQDYMRSGKSFAAHLTGMWAALESEETEVINDVIRKWLNGPRALNRPDAPPQQQRGPVTVVFVVKAASPTEHLERVKEWAHSTWKAWGAYHGLAKAWIDQAHSLE